MDGNSNRLHLNFNGNGERLPHNPHDRAFPTTPSTFPQPVFPSTGGQQSLQTSQQSSIPQQQQQQQSQSQQSQQVYGAQYPPQGYFVQNQFQNQYAPQAVNDFAAAQNSAYQPRSNTPGTNDPNVGLANQFSHQNLGGIGRAGLPYRGPAAGQRPRTAGATGQYHSNSYMNQPLPSVNSAPVQEFQVAPERNPDRYGPSANSNQKKCSQLAADFFKDSVKRAWERNQRYI